MLKAIFKHRNSLTLSCGSMCKCHALYMTYSDYTCPTVVTKSNYWTSNPPFEMIMLASIHSKKQSHNPNSTLPSFGKITKIDLNDKFKKKYQKTGEQYEPTGIYDTTT